MMATSGYICVAKVSTQVVFRGSALQAPCLGVPFCLLHGPLCCANCSGHSLGVALRLANPLQRALLVRDVIALLDTPPDTHTLASSVRDLLRLLQAQIDEAINNAPLRRSCHTSDSFQAREIGVWRTNPIRQTCSWTL